MHEYNRTNDKAIINRLSRAGGQIEAVKRMVEESRDCSEILIQIAAIKSALNNIGKIILEGHINQCVVEAIEKNDTDSLGKLNEVIDRFMQ